MPGRQTPLRSLLGHMEHGGSADKEEIRLLLELTEPADTRVLFDTAVRVRDRYFGNRIFLYGFLYFSTFCRNDCRFCQYRRSNPNLERYRKTDSQVLAAAAEMAGAGVHLIDMTMGEDPRMFDRLPDLTARVMDRTGLPVMASPGVLPGPLLKRLADSGVTWYACYQETHTRSLFKRLRTNQDYDSRWDARQTARDAGMLIEDGILTGVGETPGDIAAAILGMKAFAVDQARVMSFVPQPGTAMTKTAFRKRIRELVVIAVMRLVLPDRLIPASLDVDGLAGLRPRLNAGANVVTSIVPPQHGLAGVANHTLDIEASRRTLDHIRPVLKDRGLEPATTAEYRDWITRRLAEL